VNYVGRGFSRDRFMQTGVSTPAVSTVGNSKGSAGVIYSAGATGVRSQLSAVSLRHLRNANILLEEKLLFKQGCGESCGLRLDTPCVWE
ncbi:MAG: hypothetical protein JXA73_05775, partial [Acidobacteria bacterium]|nr:hypothetical protein [Acidobacteriota bacterium]